MGDNYVHRLIKTRIPEKQDEQIEERIEESNKSSEKKMTSVVMNLPD
jgi:hypothetical protein